MQNISFESGIKEFSINGDESRVIRFNPTDFGIVTRVNTAQKAIDRLTDEYSKLDPVEAIGEYDKKVREQINYIFGADVCTVAFGTVNCMTFCGGQPLHINFLNAVLPMIKEAVDSEKKKSDARIKKYTKQIKTEA